MYHATDFLLPDGSILSTAGGGRGGLESNYNAEVLRIHSEPSGALTSSQTPDVDPGLPQVPATVGYGAEGRRAIEAGECLPLVPAVGALQAAYADLVGEPGLEGTAAYALGFFTAAVTRPPREHPVRVFTALLDPTAETEALKRATGSLARLFEAVTVALNEEAMSLEHLGVEGTADWARGYVAFVADDPQWAGLLPNSNIFDALLSFEDPDLTGLPKAFDSLADARERLEEVAAAGFCAVGRIPRRARPAPGGLLRGGRTRARDLPPRGPKGRAQRPVPVRQREEVQEVLPSGRLTQRTPSVRRGWGRPRWGWGRRRSRMAKPGGPEKRSGTPHFAKCELREG